MCGRFTSTTDPADLAAYFGADEVRADDLGPRYNVAPTDDSVASIRSRSRPATAQVSPSSGDRRWR